MAIAIARLVNLMTHTPLFLGLGEEAGARLTACQITNPLCVHRADNCRDGRAESADNSAIGTCDGVS